MPKYTSKGTSISSTTKYIGSTRTNPWDIIWNAAVLEIILVVLWLLHALFNHIVDTRLILGLRPANGRRRYFVTTSPIGPVQV